MNLNAWYVSKQFLIQILNILVVCDVLIRHCQLSTANAGTHIRQTIVVANGLVLIVRITLACLSGIPHNLVFVFFRLADQCTTARGGNHLVAIERQHTKLTERAKHTSFPATTESFSRILHNRDVVLIGYLHNAVNIVWHAI